MRAINELDKGTSARARRMFESGRDDIDSLSGTIPATARHYARMTSADVMDQPGGTAKKWYNSLKARKELTNQTNVKGFENKDASQATGGGKVKEKLTSAQVVSHLID